MPSIVPQAIAPDNEEAYRRAVAAARLALTEAVAVAVGAEGIFAVREQAVLAAADAGVPGGADRDAAGDGGRAARPGQDRRPDSACQGGCWQVASPIFHQLTRRGRSYFLSSDRLGLRRRGAGNGKRKQDDERAAHDRHASYLLLTNPAPAVTADRGLLDTVSLLTVPLPDAWPSPDAWGPA